jgi:ABC-type amino acid transport substrate-binding protein
LENGFVKNPPRIIIAFLMASIFFVSCTGQQAPVQPPITSAKDPINIIRIGVDPNLAPFETFESSKDDFKGFDIDLIKNISTRAGIKIELVNVKTGFSQLLSSVEKCELDAGISAIPITDELKQRMDLTEPYFSTNQVLVVKTGNIKISSLDTLAGMVIGTQTGTPSQSEAEKINAAQTKLYSSYYLAFEDLISAYIDAVIADLPRASVYVNLKPNNLKIVGEKFGSLNYAIAVCKTKPDLLLQINQALSGMKSDGTLDKLIKQWSLNAYQ